MINEIKVLGSILYFIPLVVAYFVVDRLLSRYYTGSWWKEPSDVEAEKSQIQNENPDQ